MNLLNVPFFLKLGFNRGFGSLSFTEMPLSSNADAIKLDLYTGVSDNVGRYVYQLTNNKVYRGGCSYDNEILNGKYHKYNV